jgi:RNA polymerase sigma-70 factor (ECF subfamily)
MDTSMRARVRAGDPDAFRQLFGEHARSVYNHGFRLTGSWTTAEDVVSLTFLEAWRLHDRVDVTVDASLRPWLLGIATNVTRNIRRTAQRHDLALARLPRQPVQPDLADEVAAHIDDGELLAAVRAALALLRRDEREVLALCVYSGLGYAEAAEALGVPASTVRSRLSRARARLHRLVATGRESKPEEMRGRAVRRGQVTADRTRAVRFAQENNP